MWLVSRRKNPALVAFLMLLLGPGSDPESATTKVSQNITTAQATSVAASEGQLSELGTKKLESEIRKLEAEIASIRAIDAGTRWWTSVLAAIGTIVGAVVGGVFTFVITRMGHRFDRLQKDIEEKRSQRETLHREQDDRLNRLKLRQEREQARDLHNLRLFQDLGHASHRARLAAASVLLDRLRRLEHPGEDEEWTQQEIADASLIKKVLVAVLKRQTSNKSHEPQDREASADAEDSLSEAALRKYIADELVETLSARFAPEERPAEFGNSPLGKAREFQECDLTNVFWAFVDARRLDFFGSDLTKASLRGAALQEAVFYDATLCDAVLRDADLRKANLMGADLRKADLRNADLRDANLQGADLGGADLRGAKLEGAVINIEALRRFRATQWPEGFAEPQEVGTKILGEIYRPTS
jgi:hypothetical protein